ncbi:MAG: K(+)-transporting ATPase subunit C [Desulfomonile tiedjei]|nr:K(+)-transporting ATPase subunit C [Desulfomonile tiedjei]
MRNLIAELYTSLVAVFALAVLVSGIYPVVVWGLAQLLFPIQANGSLIVQDGKVVGSERIAQNFTQPQYFHPRPSAAGATGYDGASSGGSNLGPTSKKLIDSVKERIDSYRAENGLPPTAPVPADAVTASGSGLDPHISVPNALMQAKRVARARGLGEHVVRERIKAHTESPDLGILGIERVNVLKLNIALDGKP